MKRKIIAIGGGRVMVQGQRAPQTLSIDEEIVRLSAVKRPRLLFIPTASLDDAAYCDAVKRHFGDRLGCRVETLLLYREAADSASIRSKNSRSRHHIRWRR